MHKGGGEGGALEASGEALAAHWLGPDTGWRASHGLEESARQAGVLSCIRKESARPGGGVCLDGTTLAPAPTISLFSAAGAAWDVYLHVRDGDEGRGFRRVCPNAFNTKTYTFTSLDSMAVRIFYLFQENECRLTFSRILCRPCWL